MGADKVKSLVFTKRTVCVAAQLYKTNWPLMAADKVKKHGFSKRTGWVLPFTKRITKRSAGGLASA
jgi:hypothetical protein